MVDLVRMMFRINFSDESLGQAVLWFMISIVLVIVSELELVSKSVLTLGVLISHSSEHILRSGGIMLTEVSLVSISQYVQYTECEKR